MQPFLKSAREINGGLKVKEELRLQVLISSPAIQTVLKGLVHKRINYLLSEYKS